MCFIESQYEYTTKCDIDTNVYNKMEKKNVQERVNERKEQRNEIDREGDRGVRIPDSLAPY